MSLYQHSYQHVSYGVSRAVICASQARPTRPGDIGAEWVGASTWDARTWLQAGIRTDQDGRRLYVESSGPYRLRLLAAPPEGRCYRFALEHAGSVYRITIDGRPVAGAAKRVPGAELIAATERLRG